MNFNVLGVFHAKIFTHYFPLKMAIYREKLIKSINVHLFFHPIFFFVLYFNLIFQKFILNFEKIKSESVDILLIYVHQ